MVDAAKVVSTKYGAYVVGEKIETQDKVYYF